MDICFLDKTEFSYNSYDRFDSNLRGAENTLINLSEEFMVNLKFNGNFFIYIFLDKIVFYE